MGCNLRTYYLATDFYREAKRITLSQPSKNQFERAALSVVCNIAEGWGRFTKKDRKRFYYQALGSMRECQAIIAVENLNTLKQKADIVGASLYKLCIKT